MFIEMFRSYAKPTPDGVVYHSVFQLLFISCIFVSWTEQHPQKLLTLALSSLYCFLGCLWALSISPSWGRPCPEIFRSYAKPTPDGVVHYCSALSEIAKTYKPLIKLPISIKHFESQMNSVYNAITFDIFSDEANPPDLSEVICL